MSRVAPDPHSVNGVADMALDFLTTLNAARREMLGPAPAPPSLAPVIDPAERGHKAGLAPVIDVPSQRDADQQEHLARIVATSTLREELYERFSDSVDVRVAFQIVTNVLASYREALANGGQR